jgi:hypothetical protein
MDISTKEAIDENDKYLLSNLKRTTYFSNCGYLNIRM